MSDLKTKKTTASPHDFIDRLEDEKKRADAKQLLLLFQKVTWEEPVMRGESIIGFGEYHYKSERSSQEGDRPITGFSPRKQNLTLYIMPWFADYQDLLAKLGKHKTSVGCLYIKKLTDVDMAVLEKLIASAFADMKKKYSI